MENTTYILKPFGEKVRKVGECKRVIARKPVLHAIVEPVDGGKRRTVKLELLVPATPATETIKHLEMIQRAGNGGTPLSNDQGFGHGETLLIMSKRNMVDLLRKMANSDHETVQADVKALLAMWDQFVF